MIRVLSIGYGGRSYEEVIGLLRANGVTHVADVRSKPSSKFHVSFHRTELEKSLPAEGIRYVFMGEKLGGRPSESGCYDDDGRVVYERVAQLPDFKRGIKQILRGASREGCVICMLCSEAKPEECHRSKLIGEVLLQSEVDVEHISEKGELRSQAEVMQLVNGFQPDLFDSPLTSRKAYRST